MCIRDRFKLEVKITFCVITWPHDGLMANGCVDGCCCCVCGSDCVGAAGWVWALISIGCDIIVVTLENAISDARIYIMSILVITD